MIRINIPGFYDSDSGGPRWGDAQIITDGTNYEVIDGYCGIGATRLIKRLKALDVRAPYLHISHAHYDHYNGIEKIIDDGWFTPKALYCYDPGTLNANFSKDCSENVAALKRIISKARSKHIEVVYVDNGTTITHGDIDMVIYRIQPKTAENTDSYINDGSLCYWFPKLRYLTTGDGPEKIYDLCKKYGLNPVIIKIPHHGNNCPQTQANGLASIGVKYCWDNDYSTTITDFLKYGRRRCIEAGIKYISCHGDINMIFYGGKGVLYKGASRWSFTCSYRGGISLKTADLAAVKSVLKGTFGNGDTRITNLLDAGYRPASVQDCVNDMIKLIRG